MDEQEEPEGESDNAALLSQRLPATPAPTADLKIRPFRRRRSSGLLFQVRRQKPPAGPEF